MEELRPFWISWYHREGYSDYELHWPWWCSGYGDGYKTICAAVMAEDEGAAIAIVIDSYLDVSTIPIDADFINLNQEKPAGWSPFNERFQRADWMQWPAS